MIWSNFIFLSFSLLWLGVYARGDAVDYKPTSNLVDDLLYSIAKATDCVSCHGLLISLKATAHLGDDKFVNALISICKTLKIQDQDVCEGIFLGPGPIIAHDLRSIPATGETSNRFCNAMMGVCKQPPVKNYTVPFPKPELSSLVVKRTRPSRRPPFQVTHFSDIHIDRDYAINSEANCTKPLCCRAFEDQTDPITIPAGPMGNHRCDSPTRLAESLFQAIDATNSAFAIFTGDIVPGAVWLVNETEVEKDFATFLSLTGSSKIPIYPALGNHEVAPVNSYPRNTSTGYEDEAQWVYDMASEGWMKWIGSPAANQVVHHSGSYSLLVPETKLRIISLNTGFWYKVNFWLYDSTESQPDPNGLLSFMVSQLQEAEDAGERVWIMGHMPMGGGDVFHDQSNYYDQVIQRYRRTIVGQFFGHTHADEFQLAYSNYSYQTKDTATSMSWIAPALTPRSGNPAFKVYDVDPDTYEVMDMKVYSSDLSESGYQENPTWTLLYSARDLYGPLIPGGLDTSSAFTPGFWHQVTEVFEKNDTAYRVYDLYKRRNGGQCSAYEECKERTICGVRAARSENNCALLQRGFGFGRTVMGEKGTVADRGYAYEQEQCESVTISDVLVGMVEGVGEMVFGMVSDLFSKLVGE
ncbi:sphingomyelin phosphodiesterase [Dendrothele bispora CBS 962.96]|uniref:Sphingomyelin phosphodiesterase n=1 Tax=Dendrothele bispora (strain CBS 962.96) TaxID=1314807 RepID=A0A4S8L4H8_DENBC|nr:sphingomyelin phosphodiesterase [Dendrothele bispora CBS 962.96]